MATSCVWPKVPDEHAEMHGAVKDDFMMIICSARSDRLIQWYDYHGKEFFTPAVLQLIIVFSAPFPYQTIRVLQHLCSDE